MFLLECLLTAISFIAHTITVPSLSKTRTCLVMKCVRETLYVIINIQFLNLEYIEYLRSYILSSPLEMFLFNICQFKFSLLSVNQRSKGNQFFAYHFATPL